MLKIGFAEGVITPPGRVSLSGQYEIRVSEKPAEDILAVGMAVSTGRDNLFWAACDLCFIEEGLLDDVVALLKGIVCRGGTSCPDQLARALEAEMNAGKVVAP